MKIVHLFPEEFRGVAAREYYFYRLANGLAQAGFEVVIVAARSTRRQTLSDLGQTFGAAPNPRLQIRWLQRRIGPLRWGAFFYSQLAQLLARESFDLAYTMHLKAADWLRHALSAMPYVFEAHEIFAESYPERHPRFRRLTELEDQVYAGASGLVATSEYLRRELRRRYRLPARQLIQHTGIDENLLAPDLAVPEERELLYLGSLQAWKGVPVALQAMRLLPEYHLTVIGGDGIALERLRREAPPNVTLLGQLPRAAAAPYLARASLGLIPNLLEPRSSLSTVPIKLLEYSAAGRGIVASQLPALAELPVDRWVNTVESGSAAALAAGVRAFAKAPPDRVAARAWAGQFTWSRQGQHLGEFLQSFTQEKAEKPLSTAARS